MTPNDAAAEPCSAITLGELKALGAFVRQQDLDERVRALVAQDRVPPAFPLAPTLMRRTPSAATSATLSSLAQPTSRLTGLGRTAATTAAISSRVRSPGA